MVGDRLELLACQVSVNIPGRLFRGQMSASRSRRRIYGSLAEDFRPQGEECRVAVQGAFDPPPACLALAQVVRHRQQVRNA
jgi:hypothetical protein